jgi:hypothetical protein
VTHNAALRELGFSAADRVVIVHGDDVGMCNATVNAFFELAEYAEVERLTGLTFSAGAGMNTKSLSEFDPLAKAGAGRRRPRPRRPATVV